MVIKTGPFCNGFHFFSPENQQFRFHQTASCGKLDKGNARHLRIRVLMVRSLTKKCRATSPFFDKQAGRRQEDIIMVLPSTGVRQPLHISCRTDIPGIANRNAMAERGADENLHFFRIDERELFP